MEGLIIEAGQLLKGNPGDIPVVARLVDREGRVVATSGRILREPSKFGATHLHAEAAVLREAARNGFTHWEGATLYVNLEPCLKCGTAITQFFRVGRVVYGIPDKTLHSS